jgi:hypothetical protein
VITVISASPYQSQVDFLKSQEKIKKKTD